MSKERAKRRAEREAAAAHARAERQAKRARKERRDEVVAKTTGWVPRLSRSGVPQGILARRNRRRRLVLTVILVLINLGLWAFIPEWNARLALAGLTLFTVPVIWTLTFGRR